MQFHFKKGCLLKNEWDELYRAKNIISNCVYPICLGGFTDQNGNDYKAVDMISEAKEIREAITILDSFCKAMGH